MSAGAILLAWLAFNGGFAAGAWWFARQTFPADASCPATATCTGSVMDRAPRASVDSPVVNSLRHGALNA